MKKFLKWLLGLAAVGTGIGLIIAYQHPLEVLRHLKYTGVTANASSVWTRGKQERFCRDYQERFPSADGGVTLTYRPLYILVVKR